VEELHKLADDLRERTEQEHHLLDEHVFMLAADPAETYLPPERESSVPFFNFSPLDNALSKLRKSAKACDEACSKAVDSDFKSSEPKLTHLNALLQGLEQMLVYSPGLPGREWYRHMIYAPGLHTGYGVKTLPGVREAIEMRHWPEVDQYMTIIAGVLNAYGDRLEEVKSALKH
jgi:N-acetylated-alpha-linked acidic dipeptidase